MPVIPTRASPGRQKGKLQLLLERAGFCYKYRARSKSSRTTRMALLFNKPSDTICSVPLLRRAMYLCFGWKHKGFRAAGSKMQRRWPLLLIHLSLQAFGRHKRLHLFSRLPLKASYLDKDLTYPRLSCFSCRIRGWCIRSIQAEGSLSEFRSSLTPTLQDAEKKTAWRLTATHQNGKIIQLTLPEEPNHYASSTNQSDYSAYLFITKYLEKEAIYAWQSEFHWKHNQLWKEPLGLHRWGEVGKEASLTVGRKRWKSRANLEELLTRTS